MDWSESSLILKPSLLGGVGVFATHDISKGATLFNQDVELRKMKIHDIPPLFHQYCIFISNAECLGPTRFDRMEIIWYINHSSKPNIAMTKPLPDFEEANRIIYPIRDIALQNIKAGDEILVNYNLLNEPEHLKESYYRE